MKTKHSLRSGINSHISKIQKESDFILANNYLSNSIRIGEVEAECKKLIALLKDAENYERHYSSF